MTTWTSPTKNVTTITTPSKSDVWLWTDSRVTWNSASVSWGGEIDSGYTLPTKNSTVFSNPTKN